MIKTLAVTSSQPVALSAVSSLLVPLDSVNVVTCSLRVDDDESHPFFVFCVSPLQACCAEKKKKKKKTFVAFHSSAGLAVYRQRNVLWSKPAERAAVDGVVKKKNKTKQNKTAAACLCAWKLSRKKRKDATFQLHQPACETASVGSELRGGGGCV